MKKTELALKLAKIKTNNWIKSGHKKESERFETEKYILKGIMLFCTKEDILNKIANITVK